MLMGYSFDTKSYEPGTEAPKYRQMFSDFIKNRQLSTSLPKADYHTGMNDLRVFWKPDQAYEQLLTENEPIKP